MRLLLVFYLFLSFAHFGLGVVKQAKANGRWSEAGTWNPDGVPQVGDSVVIDGFSVVFDTTTPRLGRIDIKPTGVLRFDAGKGSSDTPLLLQTTGIFVLGYFEIGREDCLFDRQAKILLTNDIVPINRTLDITTGLSTDGQKIIMAYGYGRFEVHATGRTPTWSKLQGTVNPGDSSITIADAHNWKVGDEIVISTTDFDPDFSERRTISAVNGQTFTFSPPLNYNHFGRVLTYDGYSLDMRAEVAVLTSNLVIEGDMIHSPAYNESIPAYFPYLHYGGHTIFVERSIARLEGIEFNHMGQGGRLARYPIHYHIRGDASGQYVKRCLVHDSFSRSVTVHSTQNLLIESVVSFNVLGHSFYLEEGDEFGNVFLNNLAISTQAVGSDTNALETGSYVWSGCANNPLGVRLSFLDYTPSGFWITNANNTFIGNAAVGSVYGFWIRVDYVFSEPQYPCTNCPCPANPPTKLPTVNEGGLVMVDNVAHSNTESGIWIKENWVPIKDGRDGNYWHVYSDQHERISGFVAYKNTFGIENYGVGAIHFDHAIVADNAKGIVIDWQRRYASNYTNILIVGETENHGNPKFFPSSLTTNCSGVFPGVWRTKPSTGGLGRYGMRVSDQWIHLDGVTFMNYQKDCTEQINTDIGTYPGNNFLGALVHTDRIFSTIPPDRTLKNIKFLNSQLVPAFGHNSTSPALVSSDKLFMGGFRDLDGSFPCSSGPNTYFLYNTPSISTSDCELIQNWNMIKCPPQGNGLYRALSIEGNRQYTSVNLPQDIFMDWECSQTITPDRVGSNAFISTIRTDKLYQIRLGTQTPSGLYIHPNIDFANRLGFEGVNVTVAYQGQWDFQLYRVDFAEYPTYPYKSWNLLPTPETVCQCGVTYVKFTVFGVGGVELRANANVTRSCPASPCQNPWPVPAPSSYNCGQQRASNKTTETCPNAATEQISPRTWVTRPTYPVYSVPPPPPPTVACGLNNERPSSSSSASSLSFFVSCILSFLFFVVFF